MAQLKVRLLAHTPHPEKVVAAAAKLCYSSSDIDALMDGLTDKESARFVEMLTTMGHESPTEHASFTFAVEGVSRALLAQLTRHRMASFSVQSQRYVRMDAADMVVPPAVQTAPEAAQLYEASIAAQQQAYNDMVQLLQAKHEKELLEQGETEKSAADKAAKLANEDARFLLPSASATKLIMTMNARSLNHFFRLRCCNRAQWEIQQLADDMLRLVYGVAPSLFAKAGPGCVSGACPEGKMTCGKAAAVREKYNKLKSEA